MAQLRFENMAQAEREALLNALNNKTQTDTATYVDTAGDTMTGLLTVPTLTTTGQMTGVGLALTSMVSIAATVNVLQGITANANASASTPLLVQHFGVLAGPTVAPVQIIASAASQAFFDFQGGVISTASLNLSAAQLAGAVRVRIIGVGGEAMGFLPIFKGVV